MTRYVISDYASGTARALSTPQRAPMTPRRTRLLSPLIPAGGIVDVYCAEWSINRGVFVAAPDEAVTHFLTAEDAVKSVPRGSAITFESPTFRSFGVDLDTLMDAAEAAGVVLAAIPSRGNSKRRESAGFAPKLSQSPEIDKQDAVAMVRAVRSGKSAPLKVMRRAPRIPVPVFDASTYEGRAEAARHEMMNVRRGYGGYYFTKRGTLKRDTMTQIVAEREAGNLPDFSSLPGSLQCAIGQWDSTRKRYTGYAPVLVTTVHVLAKHASSRAEFERIAGLYQHGRPNIYRSQFMYWGWYKASRGERGSTLSSYRHGIRWLYAQMRQQQAYAA